MENRRYMKGLVTVGKSFINDGFSIATFDCRRAIAEWSKKQIGAYNYIVTSPNMGKRSEIAWSVWFLKWSSIAWFSGANVFRFWLVGGFKHFLFSISYMGCHPSHWRTPSFFKMVIAPPTSWWSPKKNQGSTSTVPVGCFPFASIPWWFYRRYLTELISYIQRLISSSG